MLFVKLPTFRVLSMSNVGLKTYSIFRLTTFGVLYVKDVIRALKLVTMTPQKE